MWIIPNTPQFSQFAQDRLDLSEASTAFEIFEQSLMWRSKPSQSTTWLKRWKKVRWIQHLFGQILKPSIYNHFATKYAESLVDTPVKENQSQGEENSKKTLDGFGRLYDSYSRQTSLFLGFLKTHQGTYLELSAMFSQTYEAWATHGNTPGQFLNPAWVAQLMGTTLEEILFDFSETQ